jgi:hypothetical protein
MCIGAYNHVYAASSFLPISFDIVFFAGLGVWYVEDGNSDNDKTKNNTFEMVV